MSAKGAVTLCSLALTVVALTSLSSPAGATGMVLAPAPVWRGLTAQEEYAVLSVGRDDTVQVNLFISILDPSRVPHDLCLIVPLQSESATVSARAMGRAQFREQRIAPVSQVQRRARYEAAGRERLLRRIYRASAGLAGPYALAGSMVNERDDMTLLLEQWNAWAGDYVPEALPATPLMVVSTDTYPSLDRQVLKSAGMDEVPPPVAKALLAYAGRPFALVKARTRPKPSAAPGEGIAVSFTQPMVEEGDGARHTYRLPLATDIAWKRPIQSSKVWVTAPQEMDLRADFPGREPMQEKARWLMEPRGGSVSAALAQGEQVLAVSYSLDNMDRDVVVDVGQRSRSALARERRGQQCRLALAWAGFPLLGLGAGLLAFLVAVWPDRRLRAVGLWRALGATWLMAHAMLLVPLLVLLVVRGPAQWMPMSFEEPRADRIIETLLLLGMATLVCPAGVTVVARWRPRAPKALSPRAAKEVLLAAGVLFASASLRLSDFYLMMLGDLLRRPVRAWAEGAASWVNGLSFLYFLGEPSLGHQTLESAIAVLLLLVFAVLWLALARVALRHLPPSARGLLWRAPAAALLAGVLYLAGAWALGTWAMG